MKSFVLFVVMLFVLDAGAQLKREDVVINDSMRLFESGAHMDLFHDEPDSSNRLSVQCGIADYFKGNLFTLEYRGGLAYIMGRDSMALFLVDFSRTHNEVEIKNLELESGMTLKQFERKIRRCHCKETREEVERIKGIKEIAYTVYKDDSGLGYRVFFRDGKIHTLLMYVPCK
ncbi:MAG: hypothetical protein LPK45_09175 [Bacteroidota bacterium]|nr:hypothetical protein [Bacteroidota bacterium]MDX5431255.1 hypothetical protein [Bacteroidota bacterium]MDX5469994.1 hypothetical protein [Bacteroidota bacterium]